MSDVRSKNLYELLGNDPEEDSDREPEPPTRAIDKPTARSGKRDAPKAAPELTTARGGAGAGRGGRRGGFTGNEEAFRDRNAGAQSNRRKPTDETHTQARGRGGRVRDDRRSRTGQTDTPKQVEQGWGGTSGEAELKDEMLGEAIAKKEENEPAEGEEKEPEPEDRSISYADYLAEQAARRAEGLGVKEARKPNEGTKPDKKWSQAKEIKHDSEDEEYIRGKEEKARRERQRKEKNYLDVDMRFVEPSRGRGDGRGRGRGDRGRGGRGRGDGFRGRGDAAPRGGRGQAPTIMDEKNFPTLGAK